ncbi:MAG: hypothetical protein Q8P67_28860 [archaeon]|nr:hypothetical protein [archaeon]
MEAVKKSELVLLLMSGWRFGWLCSARKIRPREIQKRRSREKEEEEEVEKQTGKSEKSLTKKSITRSRAPNR